MTPHSPQSSRRLVLLALAVAWVFAGLLRAADSPARAADKQRPLIKLIESDAAPGEKALACKQLAVCGTKDAVPALSALLPDPNLSSWARIALEVIPDPAADYALRGALTRVQGRILVGVINSIGNRRDARAVEPLAAKLKDPDAEVVSAAAVALGRIGGPPAAKLLQPLLSTAPTEARPAVAQGCILCAETLVAGGKTAEAIALFDQVRNSQVSIQRMAEATRGTILARQSEGLPILLQQLQSEDKTSFAMALRTARELPGVAVTRALAAELKRSAPDRQPWLLLALADRGDEAVLPTVLAATKDGSKKLRTTALAVLERLGDASCIPALLEAAADADADLAKGAKTALLKLSAANVDADLAARLPKATGKTRAALIELAGQRLIRSALPTIVPCLQDSDAAVRSAAVSAVGALGEAPQAADLSKRLQATPDAKERAEIENALLAVASRVGASCAPHLMPLAKHDDPELRTIALHTMAAAGGTEALAIVKAAVEDRDEAVQDEAVRTLSTWPNNWPDDAAVAEPLLALAKSGRKPAHQILGFRGYLECVQTDKKLQDADKVAKIRELMPLMKLPEEKRSAIAVAGTIRTSESLELLTTFAGDAAVAEEAWSALVSVAAKDVPGVSKSKRQETLGAVIEKTKTDATRKKAEEALKRIQ